MNGMRRTQRRPNRRGFTLIEAALATVIIGVGVLAMISAQQAFHQKNQWSTNASIAMRLGNEIREMTLNLPRFDPVEGKEHWGPEENEEGLSDFDDLDDFDGDEGGGTVFSAALGNGPINARREVIPGMEGWSQTILVQAVEPMDITAEIEEADTHGSDFVRIEVIVHHQGTSDDQPVEMTRVSWISRR